MNSKPFVTNFKKNTIYCLAYIFFISLAILGSHATHADTPPLAKIKIQLKWKHQFQFAGYYAAIEQGYFQEQGLDVELVEYELNKSIIKEVIKGRAQYGISDSKLIESYNNNEPVVLLAQIFQRSPLVLITTKASGITSPKALHNKTIAGTSSETDASVEAMLIQQLGSLKNIKKTPRSAQSFQQLAKGEVDAVVTYLSSAPYILKSMGVPITIINPQDYRIDFYGDNLFTSVSELKNHPQRVEKVKRAVLKGWQYALDNPEEIIKLIISKYAPQSDYKKLKFESLAVRQMILPDLFTIGSIDKKRIYNIANTLKNTNITKSATVNSDFFYEKIKTTAKKEIHLSKDEIQWINQHPTVTVGGTPDWPPIDFKNSDNEYTGMAYDIITLLGEKTGINFSVEVNEWNKNIAKIKSGDIDLLPAIYYTNERSQFLNFSESYMEVLSYFFIRNDIEANTMEELKGKRVAVIKGYATVKVLAKYYPYLEVIEVATLGQAIDAVLEKKADLLYDVYPILSYSLRKEGISSIIPFKSARELGSDYLHIATQKKEKTLAAIIQKGLDAISQQELDAIIGKWYGKSLFERNLILNKHERHWIYNNPIVKYGAERDWPPYDYSDNNGDHVGIAKDILNLISQLTGLTFEAEFADWNTLLEKAKSGDIALLPAAIKNQKRTEYFNFSDAYAATVPYFFVKKNSTIKDYKELNGKTAAIIEDYMITDIIKTQYPNIKILEVPNLFEALDAVLNGKADVLVEAYSTTNFMLSQNSIKQIKAFRPVSPGITSGLHLAVIKSQPELYSIIQKSLSAIPESEKIRIIEKWIDQPISQIEFTQNEKKWLKQNKQLTFSGNPNWLPNEAFDKDGNHVGIVADHLELIEHYLNIKFKKIPTKSWQETLALAKNHTVDVISDSVDSELNKDLIFTKPYFSSPVIIVMRDTENYVDKLADIRDKKIALIKNHGSVTNIRSQHPNYDFIEVDNIQDGLTAVSTKQIDALLCTLSNASYHLSTMGLNKLQIVGKTEFSTDMALGVIPEKQALVPILNKVIDDLKPQDKKAILENWSTYELAERTNYSLLIKVASILLSILLIIWLWNRRLSAEIEKRRVSEAKLSKTNKHLTLTAETIELGLWEIEQANNQYRVIFDKRMRDIYGLSEHDLISWEDWLNYIHNDDRDIFKHTIESIFENGGETKINFRILNGTQLKYIYAGLIHEATSDDHHKIIGINWDASDIEETKQELRLANIEAEKANRAKSEFLANMSHEIRTPMNSIIGFTELLDEQVKEEHLKAFIRTIRSAGKSLLALINDILDLSKIEAGKFEIQIKPCNPHDLLQDIANIFMIRVREKNIDFILEIDPCLPTSLHLDETRVRQILFNLIGNAVKFTETGFIKVSATTANENNIRSKLDLLIKVEDSGIGISEDQRDKIFKEFHQSSGQDIKKYGGTGLGLSISLRLAKMMDGIITLDSELNKGSTFCLRLYQVDVSSIKHEREEEKNITNKVFKFNKRKILVVDDIKDNRLLLIANFKDTGIDVYTAKNGLEALEMSKQHQFDLIFMDIRMPVMNGFESAQLIKEFSDVPIIALTASVMKEEFERLKSKNFDGYLRKPVSRYDLFSETIRFISYEEENDTQTLPEIVLSDAEKSNIKTTIIKLKQQEELCEQLIKSNDITAIESFAKQIKSITADNNISSVSDYVSILENDLNSFNITGIKAALLNYSKLIASLEKHIK